MHFRILKTGELNGLVRQLFERRLLVTPGYDLSAGGNATSGAKRGRQNAADSDSVSIRFRLFGDTRAEDEVIRVFAGPFEGSNRPADSFIRPTPTRRCSLRERNLVSEVLQGGIARFQHWAASLECGFNDRIVDRRNLDAAHVKMACEF